MVYLIFDHGIIDYWIIEYATSLLLIL